MALNNNQVPPPVDLPEDFEPRVVVKFRTDVQRSYSQNAPDEAVSQLGSRWRNLTDRFLGIELEPYFSTLDESTLRSFQSQPAERAPAPSISAIFTSYYAIRCPSGTEPEQIASEVATWPNVEIAYVEGGCYPTGGYAC